MAEKNRKMAIKSKRNKSKIKVEFGSSVKKFLREYATYCADTNSLLCPWIRNNAQKCINENVPLTKIILETSEKKGEGCATVLFEPIIAALRAVHYQHIQHIYIWNYPLSFENICTLTSFIEKYFTELKTLHLIDCLLTAHSLAKLVKVIPTCTSLSSICFDYNDIGDQGCKCLAESLVNNYSVIHLSLNYCGLFEESGICLGKILSTSAVSQLYVDGNDLQWDGILEMIRICADQAEFESKERLALNQIKIEEASLKEDDKPNEDNKEQKKRKKKVKKIKEAPPPKMGPWIQKLHMADNGFDLHIAKGVANTTHCMQTIKMLIMHSKCFIELDLYDNQIGNLGSLLLLEALEARKQVKLPSFKLRTSAKVSMPDLFQPLLKLSSGMPNKKKRKKKKKR